MPPTARKRPGDHTGRQAEILAAENKEALAERAEEIALTQAAERAKLDEVVDLTNGEVSTDVEDVSEHLFDPTPPIEAVVPERTAAGSSVTHSPDVHVERPMRIFRVNATIENMTYGHGNNFTFVEGQKYKAPKDVYDHLETLGYIYH